MGKSATIETAPHEGDEALEARYGIEQPYTVTLRLRGVTPFLFNRFQDLSAYAEARVAPAKKPRSAEVTDYESMVWRDDDGRLALPTQNVVASIVSSGKYYRSPIASSGGATTTLREALVAAEEYSPFDCEDWACVDFRLARNGDMKRSPKPTWRPRLEKGWLLVAQIGVITPELYGPTKLLELVAKAGVVSGIGDGRRIGFGRYIPDGMEVADGLPW